MTATMTCDADKGCTPVQLQKAHDEEQDRRIAATESAISGVHRRIDGLLLLMIATLASSLGAVILAYMNFAGTHAGK